MPSALSWSTAQPPQDWVARPDVAASAGAARPRSGARPAVSATVSPAPAAAARASGRPVAVRAARRAPDEQRQDGRRRRPPRPRTGPAVGRRKSRARSISFVAEVRCGADRAGSMTPDAGSQQHDGGLGHRDGGHEREREAPMFPVHATPRLLPFMRVAIVSDIHGNQQAFEAVLEDVAQRRARRDLVPGRPRRLRRRPRRLRRARPRTRPTCAWSATTTWPCAATCR